LNVISKLCQSSAPFAKALCLCNLVSFFIFLLGFSNSFDRDLMEPLFKVQVSLQSKYCALIIHGRPLIEQVQKSEFVEKRDVGHNNLDL